MLLFQNTHLTNVCSGIRLAWQNLMVCVSVNKMNVILVFVVSPCRTLVYIGHVDC